MRHPGQVRRRVSEVPGKTEMKRWVGWLVLLSSAALLQAGSKIPLAFGRDTVVVWEMKTRASTYSFVVRLARFVPDRHFEWENLASQGTIHLDEKSLNQSDRYILSSLFDVGVDVEAKNSTTLWLSRKVFRQLKESGQTKVYLNGLKDEFKKVAEVDYPLMVNRESLPARALHLKDHRDNEWWFLDDEDNPLLLEYKTNHFHQKLKSVSTDRKNTLRWIKVR